MDGTNERVTTPWQLPSDVATVFHHSVILNKEGMETIPGLFFEGQLSRVCKANRAFVRERSSIFDGSGFLDPYGPLDATPEGTPSFVNGGHEIKVLPTHSLSTLYDPQRDLISKSLLIVRDKLTRQVYFLLVTEDNHVNVPFKWAVQCKYNMADCLRILGCHHVRESEILKSVNHRNAVATPGRLDFLQMSTLKRDLREMSWEDVCHIESTNFRSTSMTAERAADGSSVLRFHHDDGNGMRFHVDETRLTVMVPVDEDTDDNGMVHADETVYWIDGEPFKKHQFSKYTLTNGIRIFDDSICMSFHTRPSELNEYSELCLRFGALDAPEIGWCNGLVDHEFHPNRYDLIKKHVPKQLWPPRPISMYRFMWEQKLYETRRDLAEKEKRKAKRIAEEKVEETRRSEQCTSYWGRWKKSKYAASESSCSNAVEDEECAEAREYERNNEGMLDDRVGNSSESEKEEGIRSDDHSDSDYEEKGVYQKKKRKQKKEKKHVSTKKQGKQATPKPSGLLTDRMKKMLYPDNISDSSETE